MSHYRKIDVRIHNDAKFLSLPSLLSRQLFMTILTHPEMLGMGAMRFSEDGLRSFLNTRLPDKEKAFPKDFQKAFQEVLGKGLVKGSNEDSFLYVPNFLKYNRPENPNVMKSWLKVWDFLPECELKIELYQIIKAFTEDLSKDFQKALGKDFLEGLAKGLPKTENREQRAVIKENTPLNTFVPLFEDPSKTEQQKPAHTKPPKQIKRTWPYSSDYHLTDDMRNYALSHGVVDPNDEFEAWKDDCLSNRREYADWSAAWRTRCRNYKKFSSTKNGNGRYHRETEIEKVLKANGMSYPEDDYAEEKVVINAD